MIEEIASKTIGLLQRNQRERRKRKKKKSEHIKYARTTTAKTNDFVVNCRVERTISVALVLEDEDDVAFSIVFYLISIFYFIIHFYLTACVRDSV